MISIVIETSLILSKYAKPYDRKSLGRAGTFNRGLSSGKILQIYGTYICICSYLYLIADKTKAKKEMDLPKITCSVTGRAGILLKVRPALYQKEEKRRVI